MRRLLLVLLLASLASSAAAQSDRAGEIELYVGQYTPAEGDGDLTLGVRGGGHFTERFAWQLGVGHLDDGPAELWLLDASAVWRPTAGGRATFVLAGGPGYARARLETGSFEVEEDSLTAHVAIGSEIHFSTGGRVYLRPDARLRWFEAGSGDVDWEGTVALGFTFRKRG